MGLKDDYMNVAIHAYEKADQVVERGGVKTRVEMGSYVGGRSRYVKTTDLKVAKEHAKDLWLNNFQNMPREIIIKHENKIVFQSNNFNDHGLHLPRK